MDPSRLSAVARWHSVMVSTRETQLMGEPLAGDGSALVAFGNSFEDVDCDIIDCTEVSATTLAPPAANLDDVDMAPARTQSREAKVSLPIRGFENAVANPGSARSGKSRKAEGLRRELRELTDELAKEQNRRRAPDSVPNSARSVRSDTSQQIIDDLLSQIQALQEERKSPRSPKAQRTAGNAEMITPRSERQILELQDQIQSLQELRDRYQKQANVLLGGRVEPLLRILRVPDECVKSLTDEGIEFLDDLEDYTEACLVELGFKRAHARRLLKAVAIKTAPDDAKFPGPIPPSVSWCGSEDCVSHSKFYEGCLARVGSTLLCPSCAKNVAREIFEVGRGTGEWGEKELSLWVMDTTRLANLAFTQAQEAGSCVEDCETARDSLICERWHAALPFIPDHVRANLLGILNEAPDS